MINILLVYICFAFFGCTATPNENKANTKTDAVNGIQMACEKKQTQALLLVFELPIKKGSYLELQREDNGDYPEDLQVSNGKLYVLSGEEKKIIGFDTSTKQFLKYDKINQRLLSEKENNSISTPIFLRVMNDYIVVSYDFKLLIFSSNQGFLYKINSETAINYITVKGNTLNVWYYSYTEQIDLGISHYTIKEKVQYDSANIDFADIIVKEQEKIATQNSIFSIEGKSLTVKQIKYTPYSILPETKEESFSLNCITPTYYVWFPWTIGSKIVLINKENGIGKVVDLGLKLTENNLSYEEDREGGLKITNEGEQLYFMVMVSFNGQKLIRVYQMETNG